MSSITTAVRNKLDFFFSNFRFGLIMLRKALCPLIQFFSAIFVMFIQSCYSLLTVVITSMKIIMMITGVVYTVVSPYEMHFSMYNIR